MYLTRLTLDPRNAQVRRDLANPYDMHRSLVRAFVQNEEQTPPRFLWRLEPQINWQALPVLLVQSSEAADWSHLKAVPNYLKREPEEKAFTLHAWLLPQQRYRFRLLANPTVARERKRYGIASQEAQLEWLSKQGQRQGFSIESAVVIASDVLKARKQTHVISLQRACYEGNLVATDVASFANAIQNGIGPGKAFGCGLLSLARLGR
ncbi:CRISPR-associated protein Cse3 [Lampropedia cohaerens]|uniref:CRISPR-associated protein Cse3 n=1 Tax=Lampropedia cohaerens TaxID=1610491 RepID=A0A0U1PXY1_9BURK|nr:type I-E CRISPR-associated protein Cas6/Cse3/CasE [Lampropedia cohaerens]KKW67379.1 CRISPR-associated protein Cse3 [Lampropedia cohaerens]